MVNLQLVNQLLNLMILQVEKFCIEGIDIQKIRKRKDLLKFNKKIQMIFQDPYASLNPR